MGRVATTGSERSKASELQDWRLSFSILWTLLFESLVLSQQWKLTQLLYNAHFWSMYRMCFTPPYFERWSTLEKSVHNFFSLYKTLSLNSVLINHRNGKCDLRLACNSSCLYRLMLVTAQKVPWQMAAATLNSHSFFYHYLSTLPGSWFARVRFPRFSYEVSPSSMARVKALLHRTLSKNWAGA